MILLNTYQIKQYELKLLQIDAKSLAHYAHPQRDYQNQNGFILIHKKDVKIEWAKRVGKQVNSNIKSFILILLYRIFGSNIQQNLLAIFKKHLYALDLDLSQVQGHQLHGLSSDEMKKLVVQFVYLLSYSLCESRVDDKLNKYPVIMHILIIFIRKILANLGIKEAINYHNTLHTNQIFIKLTRFFNIGCEFGHNFYKFEENHMFIFQNAHQYYCFGRYKDMKVQIHYNCHSKSLIQAKKELSKDQNEKNKVFGSHKSTKSLNTEQTQSSLANLNEKNVYVQIGEHTCIQRQPILKKQCSINKGNKLFLASNLYEINIRLVQKDRSIKLKGRPIFDIFMTSKGIACQMFQANSNPLKTTRKDLWTNLKKRQTTQTGTSTKTNNFKNEKIESEKLVKKQFRPASNLIQHRNRMISSFRSKPHPSNGIKQVKCIQGNGK